MRPVVAAAVAIFALLLLACGGDDGAAGDSGIEGVVLAGPQCPVEQPGSPCPDQPVSGVSVQVAAGGRTVAEEQTGEDGRFSFAVSPGVYEVAALATGDGPFLACEAPQTVVVGPGEQAAIAIHCDTGIR